MTTTLGELREYIEALASDDGEYYIVCGRYGDRPVPAAGLRFDSRATGRAAARAVERYRQRLREYDSALPEYDLIVCQDGDPEHADCPTATWTLCDPVVNGESDAAGELVEFCHRIAGAVFEALSRTGHEEIEQSILDCYTELAADGQRRIELELSGYALSQRDRRLPILPVVVACFTRGLDRAPTTTRVEALDDGWELTFVFGDDGVADGLASTPIQT